MIHLYTARQYGKQNEEPNTSYHMSYRTRQANEFRLLCTKEWIIENDFVAKGPYRVSRPKSVTSVRRHVTCPKCLEFLIPQAEAEVKQMLTAYAKETGHEYHSRQLSGEVV